MVPETSQSTTPTSAESSLERVHSSHQLTPQTREVELRVLLPILAFAFAAVILLNNLDSFPLYFFCDEAIHGVEAASLLSTGRDSSGAPWPLFFRGYGTFHISLSVYLHLLVQSLLPKSEFTVRLVGVVSGMIFCFALAGVVTRLYRGNPGVASRVMPYVISPLVTVTSSFFFLHFRTGFEFVVAIATWLSGIYFFERAFSVDSEIRSPYTTKNTRDTVQGFICSTLAALCFASCFYLYTPARGWIPLTLAVLSLAYCQTVYRNKLRFLIFCLLFAILLAPYLMTMLTNPQIALGRLQIMGVATWSDFIERLDTKLLVRFLEITSPTYWLSWGEAPAFESSDRHTIPGLPHLPHYLIPFSFIGVITLLRSSLSSSLSRALLLLYPLGAFPAVLVAVNPLRCAPIGVLLLVYGVVGINSLFTLIQRLKRYGPIITATSLTALCCYIGYLQRYIYHDSVRAYGDYGFYGLQMGEHKVFEIADKLIRSNHKVHLSHAAFNGNEVLVNFYLNSLERSHLSIEEVQEPCIISPLKKSSVWIIREETYQNFLKHLPKCSSIEITEIDTVTAPNGDVIFRAVELEQKLLAGIEGPPG